jgi:hypothetical protein
MTGPEHIVLSSDEAMVDLRKRDREALKTNRMRMVRYRNDMKIKYSTCILTSSFPIN